MVRRASIFVLPLVAGVLIAACGSPEGVSPGDASSGPPDQRGPAAPTGTTARSTVPSPSQSSSPSTDPALASLVDVARRDLATRLGVAESAIELVSSQSVSWGDGSLGCPQPGMEYIQVPVDGALIVLTVGVTEYRYHSGGSRPPFLCSN